MSFISKSASRREFLRRAGALSTLGMAATPLALNLAALGTASAQSAGSDYKALVCLFLYGGNDTYNTVLATDAPSWANYTQVRNQAPDSIALLAPGTPENTGAGAGSPARLGGVLALNPITPQGRGIALHPMLTGPRDLFAAGRLAIVSNVGPLLRPLTKADYRNSAVPKPASLFSHNDQQSTWQTLAAEGATAGWGGRMGDLLAAGNGNALFTSISASGNAVWLSGQNVLQYQVSTNGAIRIGGNGATTLFGSGPALESMRRVMRNARSDSVLLRDHATVVGRSIDAEQAFGAALPAANTAPYGPLVAPLNNNGLAQQLQVVARTIAGRTALGTRRQVFFVSMGGFDTHDNQNRQHADLMARLSQALVYFDNTLGAMGLRDSVTTFTASDFGRTFTSNGDGTDHGWGAHHFVMGGAVRGREVYGNFPAYGLPDSRGDFTSPNQIGNGSLLPEISVEQLGATLGRWFGVSDGGLADIFPRLTAFDASRRNLGFMA
ncbi:DUF1501 domain-containing protein [Aquabacterium sp. J223]|uniref:DUF1501 domain-containing protein n=1 Tax=Aquabacterium sp. J223 TaxID=2898431 RepID=UPI0021AE23A5|nr:DUF1501 domain-containing protein [Aquabacterium sp. J223]UUX96307.1 DUF1501 domain-containing protein [Aquabacterium sp. J223]